MRAKMRKLCLSLAIVFCAVFAMFGVLFTEQNVVAKADAHVPIQWADVDEFEAPEIGAMPDVDVHPVHFGYEVTEVFWLYKTGNYFSDWNVKKPFAPGNTYRVGIMLTAGDDYYYMESGYHTTQINGEVVDYRWVDEKTIVLMKDFTLDSYLTSVNISHLAVPVAGQLPDTEVECASENYTARVEWGNRTTHTTHDNNQPFAANTSYTAFIYITAQDGYIFKEGSENVTVYVNGVKVQGLYESGKKEISVVMYYEVGYAPVQNVQVLLDKPLPGATPDFTAECSGDGFINDYNSEGYIHGVRWIDRVAGIILTEEDTFVADRQYFVSVKIEADADHEFVTGRKYVYVNDLMSMEQSNSGSRVCGFDSTMRTPKEIGSVNVSSLLKPMEGNTPDYWLDVDVEGVTIESVLWEVYNEGNGDPYLEEMGENEKFVDGKTYVLSIYLKNSNTDKVFATKAATNGGRYAAPSATVAGEKIYPENWKFDGETEDPYNYMRLHCWYDCESEQVAKAVAWIDTPMAGATPDYSAILAGDELTVYSVTWMKYKTDASGEGALEVMPSYQAFAKDTTYCVSIIVEAKGNRKVPYNASNNACNMSGIVNGKNVDVYAVNKLDENTSADPYKYAKLMCWFTCDGGYIGAVDVAGVVEPVAGEYPSYERTILGEGYNAVGKYAPSWTMIDGKVVDIYAQKDGVMWYDITNGAYDYVHENQTFIGGHTYRLQISLEVTGDYRFAVDGDNHTTVVGTLNGYDAIIEAAGLTSEEIKLYLVYNFTCEKMAVDSINVEIAEPVIGATPDWTQIDSKYFATSSKMDGENTAMLNGISWSVYGKGFAMEPNGGEKFAENTEYMVVIYINLKEGFIIEDADKFEVYLNGISIYEAMVFTSEPATILIIYIFPKTDCNCSIKPVAEVPATCEEDGMAAHYACEKCGMMYKDAKGEELLDYGEEGYVLWATGHDFGNWKMHEEYNNYHVGTCSKCGATEEAACDFVAKFIEGPSKYSKYNGTLFVCEGCGNEGAFYVDETSCEHILGDWKANERSGGTHYRTCECGKAYEEVTCNYAITIEKCPSEYSDLRDVFLYICKQCGAWHIEPIEGEVETEESVTDTETNVTVRVPENAATVLPQGTTVTAKPVESEDIPEGAKEMMEETMDGKVDVLGGYDIMLYYNDVEIQPNATVNVCIPLGEDVSESDDLMLVYYNDFTIRKVETVVFNWEEGTVTFETDHFSKYLIVKFTPNPKPAPDTSSPDTSVPETPDTQGGCSKGCSGGIDGLSLSLCLIGASAVCFFKKKEEDKA